MQCEKLEIEEISSKLVQYPVLPSDSPFVTQSLTEMKYPTLQSSEFRMTYDEYDKQIVTSAIPCFAV